ncbi:MAG: recombinase family protein [Clostridium sp.]
MRYYGYHRTSTVEQHLDRGISEIEKFARKYKVEISKIYTDQSTGKNFNRQGYQKLKEVLREEDVLVITEMDRLGRNKVDTMKELSWLKENKIRVMVLEIPTTLMDLENMNNEMARLMIETMNNLMIEIYVTIAEAEMHKRVKRQREGLEELKTSGRWEKMGRPKVMEAEHFIEAYKRVLNGEIAPFVLMKELGMKKSTYYKYKGAYEKNANNQSCS